MTSFTWFMFATSTVLLWGAWALHRREAQGGFASAETAAPRVGRPPAATVRASVPAAPRKLDSIEWVTPAPRLTAPEARRARMRDRYIAARFPGVLRGSDDLNEIEYVVKVARHYFEEGRLDDAAELFQLAIDQSPREPALRLAQLEITFLARDAAAFTRLARALHAALPGLAEWDEVVRLGHALAPSEPMFAVAGQGQDGHYGPWPEMPNWIQASWDLTSEVLAADFHRAIAAQEQ